MKIANHTRSLWYRIMRNIVNDFNRKRNYVKNTFWSTWDVDRKKNYSNRAKAKRAYFSGVVSDWKEIDEFVKKKENGK